MTWRIVFEGNFEYNEILRQSIKTVMFLTKIMYARMLDDVLANGIEDMNGILFICFPIVELSAALSRSTMTVKRYLNELEAAGLIVRVRQGFGEPNKIYVLIPRTEG